MQRKILLLCFLLVATTIIVQAIPAPDVPERQRYWSQMEDDDPEVLMELASRMMRNRRLENFKRGLDLGFNRGFSGSQAAKHLMGLAAANYPGGPGKRRR